MKREERAVTQQMPDLWLIFTLKELLSKAVFKEMAVTSAVTRVVPAGLWSV